MVLHCWTPARCALAVVTLAPGCCSTVMQPCRRAVHGQQDLTQACHVFCCSLQDHHEGCVNWARWVTPWHRLLNTCSCMQHAARPHSMWCCRAGGVRTQPQGEQLSVDTVVLLHWVAVYQASSCVARSTCWGMRSGQATASSAAEHAPRQPMCATASCQNAHQPRCLLQQNQSVGSPSLAAPCLPLCMAYFQSAWPAVSAI